MAIKGQYQRARGKTPDGQPNPVDVHIGNRICIRRKLLGLSQEKMAEMLGLTFQQVQKYEKGSNRVSASRLWDFSQILQVDINFFFEDMPQETARQSPRRLVTEVGDVDEKILQTSQEHTSEAQELLCNYFKINNPEVAKNIFQLVKNIATIHSVKH